MVNTQIKKMLLKTLARAEAVIIMSANMKTLRAGDIVYRKNDQGRNKKRWLVKHYFKRVEDSLFDPKKQVYDVIDEVLIASVEQTRRCRASQGLPATRRYGFRYCMAEEATHLSIKGLCGAVVPVGDCEYVEQAQWSDEALNDALDHADALGRKGEIRAGLWWWE